MLNGIEYLLGKIAEECSEIQKLAMKSQLHGIDSKNPTVEGAMPNYAEIFREYSDLTQHINELNECLTDEQEKVLDAVPWESYCAGRHQKSLRWLNMAVANGSVDPECEHVVRLLEELQDDASIGS